ncbi:hypothetical protein DH2020_039519 [Rehmannia glutinosa]|uniref:Protein kinase domain-containing protein n=1 Tax=Rehmannia glutinosa TaxID=99300 RepID=A0ABR0UWC1_REHGL
MLEEEDDMAGVLFFLQLFQARYRPEPDQKKSVSSWKHSSFRRISLSDLSSSTLSEDLSVSLAGSNLHVFTLQELKVITQNFSSSNFLGEGGFGPVHKGFIDDRMRPGLKAQPVAVKLLDLDGSQGHREWLTEVIFLGQLRHAHLVKLIGYCCEEEHRLLVYEYMPRGSLENQLFRSKIFSITSMVNKNEDCSWSCKGLAFLHEAEKPVIYRDFKASNILLDSDYTAKLSDFGLAKDGPEGDDTHVSTSYGHTSFGVLLLELLTGRKSVDKSRPYREQNLAEWARPTLKNPRKLNRVMDPRLEGQYPEIGAQKAAALAYQCLSHRPKLRPTMSEVIKVLEPLKDLDDTQSGTFVYVSTDSEFSRETKRKKEMKKENGQFHHRHKLHDGHKNKSRSFKSPVVFTETAIQQNLG